MKLNRLILLLFVWAFVCETARAQTPAPATSQSTLQFSIGASALGVSPSSDASPASDVTLSLKFTSRVSLRSDNLLAPSADLQFYGGGIQVDLPTKLLAKTPLAQLQPYAFGVLGSDRIVPASGASQAHVGFFAGMGLDWKVNATMRMKLIEVGDLHTPGAPWGANAPAVSGGLSLFFGK